MKSHQSRAVLSSNLTKTLSRQKFQKKSLQSHNSFIESVKQARTLRQNSKNKSCYIANQISNSIDNQYDCRTFHHSSVIDSNSLNPILNNNFSTQRYQHNQNLLKDVYQPNENNKVYQSLQQPMKTIPLNQFINKNKERFSNTYETCVPQIQLIESFTPINPLHLKILEEQTKEQFLYKSMEITKLLAQINTYNVSFNQLKWIAQEIMFLTRKYTKQLNQTIQIINNQTINHAINTERTDLLNVQTQIQKLCSRLKISSKGNKYSKNQSSEDIDWNRLYDQISLQYKQFTSSSLPISKIAKNQQKSTKKMNLISSISPLQHSALQQNGHSWSKLIQNLQLQQYPSKQQNIIRPFSLNGQNTNKNNDQKSMIVQTFRITQNSSPLKNQTKNKTLNQLIRLSQLRRSQQQQQTPILEQQGFNKQNAQDKQYNTKINNNQRGENGYSKQNNFSKQNNHIKQNNFSKKNNYSKQNNHGKLYDQANKQNKINNSNKNISKQQFSKVFNKKPYHNDPFKQINIPFTSTQLIPSYKKSPHQSPQKHQAQLNLLRQQIQYQIRTQTNNYIKGLRNKKQQLQCQNQLLKQKIQNLIQHGKVYSMYVNKVGHKIKSIIQQTYNTAKNNTIVNNAKRNTMINSTKQNIINSTKYNTIINSTKYDSIINRDHSVKQPNKPQNLTIILTQNSINQLKNLSQNLTKVHQIVDDSKQQNQSIQQLQKETLLLKSQIVLLKEQLLFMKQTKQQFLKDFQILQYQLDQKVHNINSNHNIYNQPDHKNSTNQICHNVTNQTYQDVHQMVLLQAFTIEELLIQVMDN